MHLHEEPTTVDVLITTYGEDIEVVRRTVTAAVAMRGLHRTIVLDDGSSDEVRDLARELGAEYLRRDSNEHAKAGNVNNALRLTDGEFFVLLDADFVPRPEFLHETAAALRRPHGRIRPVAAGVREPGHPGLAWCRLHAVGVLHPHPAREEPVQRGILRGHQCGVPSRRRGAAGWHLREVEVRGHLDLDPAPRARVAIRLHPAGARHR